MLQHPHGPSYEPLIRARAPLPGAALPCMQRLPCRSTRLSCILPSAAGPRSSLARAHVRSCWLARQAAAHAARGAGGPAQHGPRTTCGTRRPASARPRPAHLQTSHTHTTVPQRSQFRRSHRGTSLVGAGRCHFTRCGSLCCSSWLACARTLHMGGHALQPCTCCCPCMPP